MDERTHLSTLPRFVLDIDKARRNRRADHCNWTTTPPDENGEMWPEVSPSFTLNATDTIFTIGSCFARRIEAYLKNLGCRVPMLEFKMPVEEWPHEPAGALNKFTPPNFRQSIAWSAAIYDRGGTVTESDCLPFVFNCGDGKYIDIDFASDVPVSLARLVERRQQIYEVFATIFTAQCVVMTPGYVECWLDTQTGQYMAGVLKHKQAHKETGRFIFELRGYEDCLADLIAAIDLVRARNPDAKFLITASPIPLATTFSGQDIRIANTYSKAIIRAVCGALPMLRPGVDYFPSYESAMLSSPSLVWSDDRIHIVDAFVGKIVARLLSCYVTGVSKSAKLAFEAGLLLRSGKRKEALNAARSACEADSRDHNARLWLARALMSNGNPVSAEREFRAVIAAGIDTVESRTGLSRAVAALGRLDEARQIMEDTQSIGRLTHIEYGWLIDLCLRLSDFERAEQLARTCADAWPKSSAVQELLRRVMREIEQLHPEI